MKRAALAIVAFALASCTSAPPRPAGVDPQIAGVIAKTAERPAEARPEAIQSAILPPLRLEMPATQGLALDPRFDLSVTNAPAPQVFMSIVSGTRYNMLVHPSVSGNISVTLKDVTVEEALAAIRDLYGYDYRMEANRIFIQPTGLQTRVFHVNYLPGQRYGSSVIRVGSGVQPVPATGAVATTAAAGAVAGAAGAAPGRSIQASETSRILTDQQATFWNDLCEALVAITFPPDAAPAGAAQAAGTPEDRQRSACNRRHATSERSIVVTPQSGVIVVRATAMELRAVENYLRATRVAVERQVMLEAKIIEVTLNDAYQAGINWAILTRYGGVGQVTPGVAQAAGNAASSEAQVRAQQAGIGTGTTTTTTGVDVATRNADFDRAIDANRKAALTGAVAGLASGSPGMIGLALQTSNFATLLTFLESQGNVQVLSSPRIATLNNQKAILKVGSDQLFVSGIAVQPATTSASGVGTLQSVQPTFAPYFAGIVLDVTPQIDDSGNITLHVHPSVSEVRLQNLSLNLGTGLTSIPTPINQVSETDTIVRVSDGHIVAIGGLMSYSASDARGGIPGGPEFLRNTDRAVQKKELVILLKPTVIYSDREWQEDLRETRGRFGALGEAARPGPGSPRR